MKNENDRASSASAFINFTLIAAITAAATAAVCQAAALPIWAMFIGWVAFFTRGANPRDGLINIACVVLGILVGIGAALTVSALHPSLGSFTVPAVVFAVGMIVVPLRSVPIFNNLLCYFLGLIAFFAAHQQPSLQTFLVLGASAALGSLAGGVAHALQHRLLQPHSADAITRSPHARATGLIGSH